MTETNKSQPLLLSVKVAEVEKQWFTSLEACKYLGIKPRTLLLWRSTGRLPFYSLDPDNVHARVYMKKQDLDKLFKQIL